jgi:hypothetical protein
MVVEFWNEKRNYDNEMLRPDVYTSLALHVQLPQLNWRIWHHPAIRAIDVSRTAPLSRQSWYWEVL